MHNVNLNPTPGKISAPTSRAAQYRPELTGVFPHARWRRRRAFDVENPRNAYQSARAELAGLRTSSILERHEAITRHTHKRWSPRDRATHDELVARCWGLAEVSCLRIMSVPRWVEPMLFRTSPKGRRMSRAGWRPFLALAIGAFRGGAAGVRLTFDELCAETGASMATAKRYVREMIEAGLLRRIKVFREVTGSRDLKRGNDSNIYQPGPVLLANWHALLEGCSSRVPYGGPNAKRARFAAHELRQDARQHRRAREIAARASHPSPELPGRLRRPDVEGHEADAEGHNADALPRNGGSQPKRTSSSPAPARSQPLPPAPSAAELDAIDAELAGLSAQRSCVGAAEDSGPVAPAEGLAPAGAALDTSRAKYQGGLTTRPRSKDRAPGGPKGPRPSAGATGPELEAAPTQERCALCRGRSDDERPKGSRCSHSRSERHREPWPLAGASSGPSRPRAITEAEAPASADAGHPLGALPPAPQIKTEPPQRTPRGDDLRATTAEDEGAEPSTGAGYDWRAGLREHVKRGGSLRFLDPHLRAQLGFDQDDDQ